MSEEQINENIQPEAAPAQAKSPAPAPAPEAPQPQINHEEIQAQASQLANQALENTIASNPLLQQFQQFQQFSQQQQEPVNPFEQELGLQNLPDAAKYAYQQGQQANDKIQKLEAQVEQMAREKAEVEYQNTLNGLKDQWKSIYGVPQGTDPAEVDKVIDQAIWNSIESDPYLAAQANAAISEQGYLTTDFLNQVQNKMKLDIAESVMDPTKRDAFLKELVKQELVRKDLQSGSMISSNIETNDSGKKSDGFSAVFIADD